MKSSIPADTILQGRPYGGTGFCKPVQHSTYHDIQQEDDRMSVVEVRNNNRVVLTLIDGYLPYFHSESTVKLWTNYTVQSRTLHRTFSASEYFSDIEKFHGFRHINTSCVKSQHFPPLIITE